MRSSIGAIILQLLGGIIPFAIFYWGFGIAIWLSIVLAVLVVGIFMTCAVRTAAAIATTAPAAPARPVLLSVPQGPRRAVLRRRRVGSQEYP